MKKTITTIAFVFFFTASLVFTNFSYGWPCGSSCSCACCISQLEGIIRSQENDMHFINLHVQKAKADLEKCIAEDCSFKDHYTRMLNHELESKRNWQQSLSRSQNELSRVLNKCNQ